MPARYAPLPNPSSAPDDEELERAFEESDEDDELTANPNEPLLRSTPTTDSHSVPGQYNFNPVFEYDYPPPPGSPPRPSSTALPNDYGNSNGFVPSSPIAAGPSNNWFRRKMRSILPVYHSKNLPRGGGLENDGVFGNVQAKPTSNSSSRVVEGDVYLVPEDAQKDAPPSYAAAAADAVPQYWETTVHAQLPDDFMVDSLPTGTLFAFLWSFILSASLQWVGFLLAYMLHTSHAGRFGSRAGLGVTLVQFGFYFRARAAAMAGNASGEADDDTWPNSWDSAVYRPHSTAVPSSHSNDTYSPHRNYSHRMTNELVAMHEWTGLFLMTIGWFLFITSLLGFIRVKRWEQSIRSSAPAAPPAEQREYDNNLRRSLYQAFSIASLRNGAQVRAEVDESPRSQAEDSSRSASEDRRLRDSLRAVGLV